MIIPKGIFNFENYSIKEVRNKEEEKTFKNLWIKIWIDEGYIGRDKTFEDIRKHYSLYDKYSRDFILYFNSNPIGTIRVIFPNQEIDLPVIKDFKIIKDFDKNSAEFTLFTLVQEFRSKRAKHIPSLMLMRAAYRCVRKNDITGILMAADFRLFSLLNKLFEVKIIGPPQFYEGSKTIPAFIDIPSGEKKLQKTNPMLYKFFVIDS